MGTLTSIAPSHLLIDSTGEDSIAVLEPDELQLVMTICEWMMSCAKAEADEQSRLIKALFLKRVEDTLNSNSD